MKTFSKTIALTYLGFGLCALFTLIAAFVDLRMISRSALVLIPCAIFLSLAVGFIYLILAIRQRSWWARYAAVIFWLLCLIWSAFTIARNGLHPGPPAGPLQYSNADQLAGARFATLATPYFMAALEATALYCWLRKASVVNQFKKAA